VQGSTSDETSSTASLSFDRGYAQSPRKGAFEGSGETGNGIEGKNGRMDEYRGRDSIEELTKAWCKVGGNDSVLLGGGAGSSSSVLVEDCEEEDGRGTKKEKRRKGQGIADVMEGKEVKRRKGGADAGAVEVAAEGKRGKMTNKSPVEKQGTPGGSRARASAVDGERSVGGSGTTTGRRKRGKGKDEKIVEGRDAVEEVEERRKRKMERIPSPTVDFNLDPIPTETFTVELNEMIRERELDAAVTTPNPVNLFEFLLYGSSGPSTRKS
jgi:hypothetical protein